MLTIILVVLTLVSIASSFLLKKFIPRLHILVCVLLSFALVFASFIAFAFAIVKIIGF